MWVGTFYPDGIQCNRWIRKIEFWEILTEFHSKKPLNPVNELYCVTFKILQWKNIIVAIKKISKNKQICYYKGNVFTQFSNAFNYEFLNSFLIRFHQIFANGVFGATCWIFATTSKYFA